MLAASGSEDWRLRAAREAAEHAPAAVDRPRRLPATGPIVTVIADPPALGPFGRVERTLFMLDWLESR